MRSTSRLERLGVLVVAAGLLGCMGTGDEAGGASNALALGRYQAGLERTGDAITRAVGDALAFVDGAEADSAAPAGGLAEPAAKEAPREAKQCECYGSGDVSADGVVSAGDAQLAFFIALGSYPPTEAERCAADCNADGTVSAGDAQGIFLAALGSAFCPHDLADGECCHESRHCTSQHCENGFCCATGDCCNEPADCPASYSAAPLCVDVATCQGVRNDAECTDFMCATGAELPDDSACHGALVASDCGLYPAVYCTGAVDQTPPECPTTCAADDQCDVEAHCAGGLCLGDLGAGQPCDDAGDCLSAHCQNGFCCAAGDCCASAGDCPAGYSEAARCVDPATCQGARNDAECVDSVCGTSVDLDDDTACDGATLASACGFYPAVYCSGDPEQGAPECATSCAADGDCDADAHCTGGVCLGDLGAGAACMASNECASGHCVDGVCCTSACAAAPCFRCDVAGSVGTCAPTPYGLDPDAECGAVACSGFFWGFVGQDCFERAPLSAGAVTCDGSGACLTAGDLCPLQDAGAVALHCDDDCGLPGVPPGFPDSCFDSEPGVCHNNDALTRSCGLGICYVEEAACIDGLPNPADCVPGPAGDETCNGLDDDCNGTIDDASLVCAGCQNGICPVGAVRDGTLTAGTDLRYQYSPTGAGAGYLKANWEAVSGASGYLVRIGTTVGGQEVLAPVNVGAVTSYSASGLTLQGAWTGAVYYVTVSPVGALGSGAARTSNGVQVAEVEEWNGATTSGLNGGFSANWPQSGVTAFFGTHYFERVNIASGTTVNVQGWGRAQAVAENIAPSAPAVTAPADGFLRVYANTIDIAGTVTASGRGYGGGGGGGGGSVSVALQGRGGNNGLGGAGGNGEASSYTGCGGGGSPGGLGGTGGDAPGGNGNLYGGGSGSSGCSGVRGRDGGDGPVSTVGGTGGTAGSGSPGAGGAGEFAAGGGNGVAGCDNWTGGGGGGYGGGGSGGTQWSGPSVDAGGGGGGGSGGGGGGHSANGAAGAGPYAGGGGAAASGAGGRGGYRAAGVNGDSSTDRSIWLGSGGGGGGAGIQEAGGGGGGAGGGALAFYAYHTLTLTSSGRLLVNGAGAGGGGRDDGGGTTSAAGGGGAGGGLLLEARTLAILGTGVGALSARGGAGELANGGTIKLFYQAFSGTRPGAANAGRVYDAGAGSFVEP